MTRLQNYPLWSCARYSHGPPESHNFDVAHSLSFEHRRAWESFRKVGQEDGNNEGDGHCLLVRNEPQQNRPHALIRPFHDIRPNCASYILIFFRFAKYGALLNRGLSWSSFSRYSSTLSHCSAFSGTSVFLSQGFNADEIFHFLSVPFRFSIFSLSTVSMLWSWSDSLALAFLVKFHFISAHHKLCLFGSKCSIVSILRTISTEALL